MFIGSTLHNGVIIAKPNAPIVKKNLLCGEVNRASPFISPGLSERPHASSKRSRVIYSSFLYLVGSSGRRRMKVPKAAKQNGLGKFSWSNTFYFTLSFFTYLRK